MSERLGNIRDVSILADSHEFQCDNGRFLITCFKEGIVRFQATFDDLYRRYESVSVIESPMVHKADIMKKGNIWGFHIEDYEFVLTANPFSMKILDPNGSTVLESHPDSILQEGSRFEFQARMIGEEYFYGMGEKAHGLNKRGLRYEMWNTDNPAHDVDSDPLYQAIPFFITLLNGSAFGVFLDNTYRSFFDFGSADKKQYSFGAPDGPIDIYFILGPSLKTVLDRYTQLTGRPHFIPRWALGHQHSRWMEYTGEEDLLSMAKGLREHHIPCDTIVLDIGYMDEFRIFTWNDDVFPNPQSFIDQLSSLGFRVMSIIDPGVKLEKGFSLYEEGAKNDYFLKRTNGEEYIGLVWPGETVFPDFSKQPVRDWFAQQYQRLAKTGLSNSSWLDMNEPSYCIYQGMKEAYSLDDVVDSEGNPWEPRMRNVYAMGMIKAAFDGLREAFPNQRPFILTRSGFAGYQRYAAMWTGDNHSKWEHLWLSIPMLLNIGLSGIPICGADIGGFGGDVSDELLARWYQLGAFYPFSRNHSMINTRRQEPWLFDTFVVEQARHFLEIRYKILRYLYSLAYESSNTGFPIMRPLVFEFQDDPRTYEIDTQFMIGPFILVAPVLKAEIDSISVYLPEGLWYDYWTSSSTHVGRGGMILNVETHLDRMPLFIRGGAIIPTGKVVRHTGEDQGDLVIVIYPGNNSEFSYYEDDGISETGSFSLIKITLEQIDEKISIKMGPRLGTWMPPQRNVIVDIRGVNKIPQKVLLDDAQWESELRESGIHISFIDDGQPHSIFVEL
ncbi:MAG: putative Alpha-glucosidase 2 [Candidatus Thorarchaeota archaeon]|nr:MAG: putative Alpha-glucosidase 2 [Candidatus Thorarchaeota archaeon]